MTKKENLFKINHLNLSIQQKQASPKFKTPTNNDIKDSFKLNKYNKITLNETLIGTTKKIHKLREVKHIPDFKLTWNKLHSQKTPIHRSVTPVRKTFSIDKDKSKQVYNSTQRVPSKKMAKASAEKNDSIPSIDRGFSKEKEIILEKINIKQNAQKKILSSKIVSHNKDPINSILDL